MTIMMVMMMMMMVMMMMMIMTAMMTMMMTTVQVWDPYTSCCLQVLEGCHRFPYAPLLLLCEPLAFGGSPAIVIARGQALLLWDLEVRAEGGPPGGTQEERRG
jgi:hypothetical protein